MNRVQYFFLMLKQGIKGVFHFKAQFTIILILSFLSTLILSLSLSTGRRIENSYDKVVSKVDKFDYEAQFRIGKGAGIGNSNKQVEVFPINQLVPGDYVAFYNDANDLNKATTHYNFILSHPETYEARQKNIGDGQNVVRTTNHKNFINQSYILDEFKEAFILDPVIEEIDPKDAAEKEPDPNTEENQRWVALRKVLLNTLIQDLDLLSAGQPTIDDNLKYSVLGNYTVQHPFWYAPFVVKDGSGKYDYVDWIKTNDLVTRQQYLVKDNHFEYFFYLNSILDMVLGSFDKVWKQVNPLFKSQHKVNMNNAQLYALIFGDKINPDDNTTLIPERWLINEDGSNQYSIWFETNKPKSDYVFFNQRSDDVDETGFDFTTLLLENGLKGIMTPTVDHHLDDEQDWKSFQVMNYSQNLGTSGGVDAFTGFSLYNDPYLYRKERFDVVKTALGSDQQFTLFLTTHHLAGDMFNYETKIRREATFFDAPKTISYRGIIVDDQENYNLTVLKGRGLIPQDNGGELLLSEQFPRKKKIKVGDFVEIGNGIFSVVGFGTDAFSFLPSQDLLNPLPNPIISTFMYGTAKTLEHLNDFAPGRGSSGEQVTTTLNLLFWDYGTKKQANLRREGYFAAIANTPINLHQNQALLYNYINQTTDDKVFNINQGAYNLTAFNDSNYQYSWTIAPRVTKIFLSITGIASAVIIVIVLASLFICVKKTVQFNAKQIGILKAMGSSPAEISISYISYSIIIMLLAIPLGWIVGTVLQIPFAEMFLTYFSIVPDIIFFDWISFVVMFFGVGLVAAIVGYTSAYVLTNTSVMKILANPIKWHNSKLLTWIKFKILPNAKFQVRFSLTLSNAGSRQIWLMSAVILITSILVTMSLVIPSVAQTANRLFYRSIHYNNEYQDTTLTVNAPLSKAAISYWQGHDALDSDFANKPEDLQKLDNSGKLYGYYRHPESYLSTISNAMVLPQYLYQPAQDGSTSQEESLVNTFAFLTKSNDELLGYLTDMFGNNFYNNIGVGFSIGMIDSMYGIILHSLDRIDENGDAGHWTDDEKRSYAQEFSGWLVSSIPDIIQSIVNANSKGNETSNPNENPDSDGLSWKQQIIDVLYAVVPTYVRSYVERSESRLDQYAITYQNEIYIPEQETLTTTIKGNVISNKNHKPTDITLTGLDRNQTAVTIEESDKQKVYLPKNVLREIEQVLTNPNYDQNIVHKNKRIYDASTHTLTLPIIGNRQAQARFNFGSSSTIRNFTNDVQTIQLFADQSNGDQPGYVNLPQGAWLYDDTSFYNLAQKSRNFEKLPYEMKNNRAYLDPYVLDNNKFSFKSEFILDDNSQDTDQLVDAAYLFKDFILNDNQEEVERIYTRPYYQYKDLKLFLPMSYIPDLNKALYPSGNHGDKNEPKENNDTWYELMSEADVPDSVKTAWKDANSSQYLVINPYDLKYFNSDIEKMVQNKNDRNALQNLVTETPFWFLYANSGGQNPILSSANVQKGYAHPDLKINLQNQGMINSFNQNFVVIDSDLANMLMGIPTMRQYQYNYSIFDDKNVIPAGVADDEGIVSVFDRYANRQETFKELNTGSSLWYPKIKQKPYLKNLRAEDYAPHSWYNGKLSNIEEALSYSTIVSYAGDGRLGMYAIGSGSWTGIGVPLMIENSVLLSEQRALMSQISGLAVSIGSLLLIAIIITASLLIMLVSDIYINQYRQFMVLMKALGYSNWTIIGYSLGTATVFAAIMLVAGHVVGWILVSIIVRVLGSVYGFAIPFGFNWWVIPSFILIMAFSYFVSLAISSYQVRHDPPTKILVQANG